MPTEPQPVTVARIVHRAVEVCELGDVDDTLDDLLVRFEDADEPASPPQVVEQRIDEAVGAIDDEDVHPALAMARAVAVYLCFRHDEVEAPADRLLRLAARAEFDGHPPPAVSQWLRDAGVDGLA